MSDILALVVLLIIILFVSDGCTFNVTVDGVQHKVHIELPEDE